jgi:hypothetical protein
MLFSALLVEAGWDKTCGPVPGVWSSKVGGARCLWSCSWARAGGVLHPDRYLPVGFLTDEYLCWELADNAVRADNFGARAAELSIRYFAQIETNPLGWSRDARALLGQIRQGYKDFTWPYLPPSLNGDGGPFQGGRLLQLVQRPGWELSKLEILQRAGGY